jgi:hypothetical protein
LKNLQTLFHSQLDETFVALVLRLSFASIANETWEHVAISPRDLFSFKSDEYFPLFLNDLNLQVSAISGPNSSPKHRKYFYMEH